MCRWALVKDEAIAKKMVKFIEITSIGVSKDSQVRAAKILDVISDTYEDSDSSSNESKRFFDYAYDEMAKRWSQLREAVNKSKAFSLPTLPVGTCNFSHRTFATQSGNIAALPLIYVPSSSFQYDILQIIVFILLSQLLHG